MRKPSALRIDARVTRTALDLRACGHTPVRACDASLDIRRAGYRDDRPCGQCGGCGCGSCCQPVHKDRAVTVRAFNNDDAGRLVFVWGDALRSLDVGLYLAVLNVCGRALARFTIQLGESERPVARAENFLSPAGCDPLNGCGSPCDVSPACTCLPSPVIYIPPFDVPARGGA